MAAGNERRLRNLLKGMQQKKRQGRSKSAKWQKLRAGTGRVYRERERKVRKRR